MIILRGDDAKFFALCFFIRKTIKPAARRQQTTHGIIDIGHGLHLKKNLKRLMQIRERRFTHTAIKCCAAEHALDGHAALFMQHGFNRFFKSLNKRGKIQFFHQ